MTGSLIIVRHGNTFEAGEPVVWVGGTNDLPLTLKGEEQASLLGRECAALFSNVEAIYHGPLLRTVTTAVAIAKAYATEPPLILSEALRELDYGTWTGLSDDAIKARFGVAEYEAWQQKAVWPSPGQWDSSQEQVGQQLSLFLKEITPILERGHSVIAVTSNGLARELLRSVGILPDLLRQGISPKLLTGAYGELRYTSGHYEWVHWNKRPDIHSEQKKILSQKKVDDG